MEASTVIPEPSITPPYPAGSEILSKPVIGSTEPAKSEPSYVHISAVLKTGSAFNPEPPVTSEGRTPVIPAAGTVTPLPKVAVSPLKVIGAPDEVPDFPDILSTNKLLNHLLRLWVGIFNCFYFCRHFV